MSMNLLPTSDKEAFQNTDRELYLDFSEISPWNPSYLNRFKRVSKPTWRYLSGTMPDFHQLIRGFTSLNIIFAFLRSLGMWLGISNPFLGLCVFIALCLESGYLVLYVSWCVVLVGLWAFYLGVPEEQIKNGLYPSQGVLLGMLVYVSNEADDANSQLIQLAILIPVTFLTLILFQAIGTFLVRTLRATPLFVAPALVGFGFYLLKRQSTYMFNKDYEGNTELHTNRTTMDFFIWCTGDHDCQVSATQFGTLFYQGFAGLVFSDKWEAAIPLAIGLLIASPILFLTAWLGLAAGAASAVLLSPLWSGVASQMLLFPCAITMMSISGLYFVLSVHSVLVGFMACFLTTVLALVLNSTFELLELTTSAPLAAYFIIIVLYITGAAFPRILQVELMAVTTPEDHIRRFILSQKIIKDLRISDHGRVNPSAYRNIESSILPILLCAYAKHNFEDLIKDLLDLGADPNASDYDGRCALHIACAENRTNIVTLLMRYQADLHKLDNFNNNALSSALLHSHFTLAKYIFKQGGRLRMKKSKVSSMLCYMVSHDDLDRLKVWLECGADPNSTDYDNRTPLHVAYAKKNDKMIKFLSRYAPKKEIEDRWGKKPSECYGQTVHDLEPVKDVKKKTRDVTRSQGSGGGHHLTIDPGILEAIIRQLLRSEEKPKIVALLPSLICELVSMREHGLLDRLIKENIVIDLNLCDYDLRTPLHIACAIGDLEIAKSIVWHQGNLNAIDRFGNSPLLEACRHKHDRLCDFLLDEGAQLCLPFEMQVSELCWAVSNNDFEMIQRLVEAGINMHVGDYDGRTCLAVAYDNKNKKMMEMLKQYIEYDSVSWSSDYSSEEEGKGGKGGGAAPLPTKEAIVPAPEVA